MPQLFQTNLIPVASPLPADFNGTPQDLFEAMIERLSIQSPVGTQFFVVGGAEPSTNQGPWLKDGTKWYVFSESLGRYVPLDISDSIVSLFIVSETEPDQPVAASDPRIWLRTVNNRVIGWYFSDGNVWRPGGNVDPSGPTTARPTSPVDLEKFFDTDINVLIHWERGAWRTVSGSPGDVKFVTTPALLEALTVNPGWTYLGDTNQSWSAAILGVAAIDPGASPVSSFPVDTGRTQWAQGAVTGTETHILSDAQMVQHSHLIGALTLLNSDNNIFLHRVDDGTTLTAPTPPPPNHALILGDGGSNGTQTGVLPATAAGTMLVTSRQLTVSSAPTLGGIAAAHPNMQPTVFLWALQKG